MTLLRAAILACLVGLPCVVWGEDKASPQQPPDRKALEQQFQKMLSGATLLGHYTVGGEATPASQPSGDLPTDKYVLLKVSKLQDDYWFFKARIQYGEHDLTLPLTLKVKWAGDTPVITLDDLPVPGLGTFSARVMFFRGQYAGTWSGKDHGGHLFGQIIPPQKKTEP